MLFTLGELPGSPFPGCHLGSFWRYKGSELLWYMQAFLRSETHFGTLWNVVGTYTIYFALFTCISRRFLLPLCRVKQRTASWIQLANLWDEWSWHSSISPTSSRIRPGRNSEVCWQMILPRVISHSWIGARSCRRKSILFTNTWGTRKVPHFSGVLRGGGFPGGNWNFPRWKVRLSSEQTPGFLKVPNFPHFPLSTLGH